jgi:hypothetical protein
MESPEPTEVPVVAINYHTVVKEPFEDLSPGVKLPEALKPSQLRP